MKSHEDVCMENGYRLLFEAEKHGHITLNRPELVDFANKRGEVNQEALKRAYLIWKNNCYDLIMVVKLEGKHWRFSKDWKDAGSLFVYDATRMKKVI